jgi:CTP:molybdopterin cytidylyltransferase MocA
LAAGAGSRFSSRPGEKLLASIEGRPMLVRVLSVLREHGPAATIVVLGHGADEVEAAIDWHEEVRILNPVPDRGISSSLRIGIDALDALSVAVDGAFIVLADQPQLRTATLRALERAAADPGTADRHFMVPWYFDDPGPINPVLVRRVAWPLVRELSGDRGLGPFIRQHPELCLRVPIAGTMRDVDSLEDLDELRWD